MNFSDRAGDYLERLSISFTEDVLKSVEELAGALLKSWKRGANVYLCGNGGSGANAIHIANDLHYGTGACGKGEMMTGLKVEALTANSAILTCLANDIGYASVFAHQLEVKAKECDVLIVLSGSGSSENIVKALETGERIGMKTFAVVGFDGGLCKDKAHTTVHFKVNDMQIAEDTQLIVGHMCMQWLSMNKPETPDRKDKKS